MSAIYRQRSHQKKLLPVLLFILLAFVSSCRNEIEEAGKASLGNELATTRTNGDVLLAISYESETTSLRLVEGNQPPKKYELLYKTMGVPIVSRTKVEGVFLKSGQEEWTFTTLDPTIKIPTGKENIPADDSPKVKTTRIKNGIASFFDENGKLIRQSEFPSSNLDNLRQIISQADTSYLSNIDKQIQELQRQGSVVSNMGNEVVSIRTKINPSDFYVDKGQAASSAQQFESLALLDKKNGIMIGNSLYGSRGELLQQVFYRYAASQSGRKPELQFQHCEGFNTDNNGIAIKTITDIQYKDFKIERF
ncbi:hypothetical protein LZD49_32665 [Dyadobacter sp. CY261]|uniref:hypothetical protein n=1 Tax=Dyadobacter sp. CY261 TaxID=2907203 RepID=UPI001F3D61DE|nr:hypothetical protein [Dyadobacter sp. CY261]MCF0075279.1 hypothetical protein [Dyadobacter sp. CY261]